MSQLIWVKRELHGKSKLALDKKGPPFSKQQTLLGLLGPNGPFETEKEVRSCFWTVRRKSQHWFAYRFKQTAAPTKIIQPRPSSLGSAWGDHEHSYVCTDVLHRIKLPAREKWAWTIWDGYREKRNGKRKKEEAQTVSPSWGLISYANRLNGPNIIERNEEDWRKLKRLI